MTLPKTPRLWLPGDDLNKTNLDADMRDQVNSLIGAPNVYVTASANQSLTTSVETSIAFNVEAEDSDGMHDNVTNNTRVTVPVDGLYHVLVSIRFAPNATGFRYVRLRKNGVTYLAEVICEAAAGVSCVQQIEKHVRLVASDYLEVRANQSSGGALNSEFANGAPAFQVIWERA